MMNNKSFWMWVIFLLCVFTFGIASVRDSLEKAEKNYPVGTKSEWGVTDVWLSAAECMRKRGAWLSVCEGDELYPIANHAPADDPGHALLLGLKAKLQDTTLSLADVASINITINFAGLMVICALLMATRLYAAALFMLFLWPQAFYSWNITWVHSAAAGAVCFAALFPMTLLLMNRGLISVFAGRVLLLLSLPLLGLAALLREPIGIMGLVVGIGALIVDWLSVHKRKKLFSTLVLVTLVVLACKTPRFVLMARDMAFPMHPTTKIQTHGIAHTLYLGLGVVENKFGIRWDDAYGEAVVKALDPSVSYVSERYFQLLWQLYWQRVQEDPIEVARIYFKKAFKILEQRLPDQAPPFGIVLIGAIVAWRFISRRNLWFLSGCSAGPVLFTVSFVFIGFFILQGAISHPRTMYSYPIGVFVLIIIAMLLELWLRCCWKTADYRPDSGTVSRL